MNPRLEQVIAAARKLPDKRQEELAEMFETAVLEPTPTLAADDLRRLEEGIADADSGRFATDEEVEELLARFGRA